MLKYVKRWIFLAKMTISANISKKQQETVIFHKNRIFLAKMSVLANLS